MNAVSARNIWLLLMALTGIAWLLGERGDGGLVLVTLLLGMAAFKGSLVAERFMGLDAVRPLWRWLVLGWLYLTTALIGFAYWLGLQ